MFRALTLAVIISLIGCKDRQALSPGYKAPELNLAAIDGSKTTLSSFVGKVIVLNFWASWCEPCMQEMPALQRASEKLSGSGVEFVGVGVGETTDNVKAVASSMGLTFKNYAATLDQVEKYKVTGYPETFIVDQQGKLVLYQDPERDMPALRITGPREWDSPDSIARLKALKK